MKRLKKTFERAGMDEVRTYINSGNVVFRSNSRESGRLAKTLESAIEADFGFPVAVLLRDVDSIKAMVKALPDTWANDKAAKCDVIFLGQDVDTPKVLEQLVIKPGIDEVKYAPGALLWHVDRPNVTRSGLMRLVGTELYAQSTVRNCNTLRKLAQLMQ